MTDTIDRLPRVEDFQELIDRKKSIRKFLKVVNTKNLDREKRTSGICREDYGERVIRKVHDQDNDQDDEPRLERAVSLPCGHIFGKACVTDWMMRYDTCPWCPVTHVPPSENFSYLISSSTSLASSVDRTPSPSNTDASSATLPSPPLPASAPTYTVVNDVPTLREFLDAAVKHLSLPPKLYSQALLAPLSRLSLAGKDSRPALTDKVSPTLPDSPVSSPELYVDAEGISLGRDGELSILIIHLETPTISHTYLIHVHMLKRRTFSTKDSSGMYSLRTLFQDNRIPKILFDCRMDSDALFGQFQVILAGVIDLQLMCLASRGGERYRLPGLEACLLADLDIGQEEMGRVAQAKARDQVLWRPRCGGSMQRFNDNPLHEEIINYCVVDTAYLPRLFTNYNRSLGNAVSLTVVDHHWACKVIRVSKERAELALKPGFCRGTSLNPWYVPSYDDDNDFYGCY